MFDYSALSNSGLIVTFLKKDGTERVMRCTTNLDMIPAEKHPKGDKPIKEGEEKKVETAKRVFDLEKQEWRSFRYDSVIAVSPL